MVRPLVRRGHGWFSNPLGTAIIKPLFQWIGIREEPLEERPRQEETMSDQRLRGWATPLAIAAIVGATSTIASAQAGMNTTSLQHDVVLEDLDNPWDMAFLDDGTMFFTERCKGLSVRMPSGEVTALLGMEGSDGYPATAGDLFCEGQGGMMGVDIDPDFEENRRIYFYASSNMSDPHTNRLMRLVVDEGFTGVSDRTDIVDD